MSNKVFEGVGIVILAAGQGKRLNCTDHPKVMHEIAGRPIVSYIVETLEKCGATKEQIMLVVGFHKEKVIDFFGSRVSYAVQDELLGTAHAAYVGMKSLDPSLKKILVLNGDDTAFYRCPTLTDFVESHIKGRAAISLLSVELSDPTLYGRIIRHEDGTFEIIEKEYLTEEQKKIKEVSTGTFCFDRDWFEKIFPAMPKLRKLGEFGLPTTLAMARNENLPVQVIKIKDNNEWFGVNTPEELAEADGRMKYIIINLNANKK